MTDEKIAEDYFCDGCENSFEHENGRCSNCTKWQFFIAGLKAGRPKFHKVIDGFMPPIDKGNDTINVLTDKGDIAYYSYNFDCWVAEPSSMEIEPPIAWCEIPKYTEE